jgi:hypothetical protein
MQVRVTAFSVVVALMSGNAFSAPSVKLVPAFADHVPGRNGSVWQSELRLYNSSQVSQLVSVQRVLPSGDASCTGFNPITMGPGALAQVRSIGCSGTSAAVEVVADDSVDITSVITNVGPATQDPCCLTGYTQTIPVLATATAYTVTHTIPNLQIPVILQSPGFGTNLGRHNLIFVNPNDTALAVTLQYFDATGALENGPPFPYFSATVPAHAYSQLNDIFPQLSLPFETPAITGWRRVEASAAMPFYVFDSYVDNATNDATTIESR